MSFRIVNKATCEEGAIVIDEEPYCEHCGKMEPYDIIISDGGTYWCEMCSGEGDVRRRDTRSYS